MLKINFSQTAVDEKWILHGRLSGPWVARAQDMLEGEPPHRCGTRVHRGPQ